MGAVGQGRPDLLAVEEPATGYRNRSGLDTSDVRSCAGFGEQLAPHFSSGEDAWHVALSLRAGSELEQRRQTVPEGDGELLRHERETPGLVSPRRVIGGWETVTAVLSGHAETGQAGAVERPLELECPIECEIPTGIIVSRGGHGCGGGEEAAGVLPKAFEFVIHRGGLPAAPVDQHRDARSARPGTKVPAVRTHRRRDRPSLQSTVERDFLLTRPAAYVDVAMVDVCSPIGARSAARPNQDPGTPANQSPSAPGRMILPVIAIGITTNRRSRSPGAVLGVVGGDVHRHDDRLLTIDIGDAGETGVSQPFPDQRTIESVHRRAG